MFPRTDWLAKQFCNSTKNAVFGARATHWWVGFNECFRNSAVEAVIAGDKIAKRLGHFARVFGFHRSRDGVCYPMRGQFANFFW